MFMPAVETTFPFTQWVLGAVSPGINRLDLEANSVTDVEVKNVLLCTSTYPYALMARCLIKPPAMKDCSSQCAL